MDAGILIVEDSAIVAWHLQKVLESRGYRVAGIEASGEAALERIGKEKPDLILMDIMLKGKQDGIETARVVRSVHHLPVIYITALSDHETIQRAKVTEPFGFITKPFEDHEIFAAIETTLYKHEIESQLRESEERFFSTVRSISDAVILIDSDLRVVYMNPGAETITGWKLFEIQQKPMLDVLTLKDSQTGEQPINPFQCSLDHRPRNTLPDNLLLLTKEGKQLPVGEGSVSPIINSRGKLMGSVMIFKDISEKVEHQRLLREFEVKRMAALLEGQEKERSRIARDLHDGLGQMLNAIKMNLESNRKDWQKTLYRLIDEAIHESVRISEDLMPSKLKDFDLATCLKSLCNHISDTTDVPVMFESFGKPQEISQLQKTNLYRIAQEAINNALRHARASTISVQLCEEDGAIHLMIEDDGKGFDHHKRLDQAKHHGLTNMQERAVIMGGKLAVESDARRGTLVMVEVPLQHKDQEYVKV